jgi:F0F1-type ATP synthase assembly protein I
MIKRITKFSLIITIPIAVISFFFTDLLFAFNVLLGGIISLLSFRVMTWAVTNFIGQQMAQAFIMGISVAKLLAIFITLALLAYFQLIKAVPLLAGFTLVLGVIIVESLRAARKASQE